MRTRVVDPVALQEMKRIDSSREKKRRPCRRPWKGRPKPVLGFDANVAAGSSEPVSENPNDFPEAFGEPRADGTFQRDSPLAVPHRRKDAGGEKSVRVRR